MRIFLELDGLQHLRVEPRPAPPRRPPSSLHVTLSPLSFASIELGASSVTVLWGVQVRFYVTTSMSQNSID